MRLLLLTFLAASLSSPDLLAQEIDHRYAPYRHLNAICFPDDWLKTVVTERNALAYDFGPGPYAVPLTEISIGVQSQMPLPKRQYEVDPRVPIAVADFDGSGVSMHQTAFAIPLPPSARMPAARNVERLLGWSGTIGWASVGDSVDPAFRNVAWGVNRPVLYRVRVPRMAERLVGLGILEPYKPGPGLRILELRVEGAPPLTIDPAAEGKKGKPLVALFNGRDENGDGQLAIEVHASDKSPDPNCYLNAFWIFPKGAEVREEELMRGTASRRAELYVDCGREEERWRTERRLDGLISEFRGSGYVPEVRVRTRRPLVFDEKTGMLVDLGRPYIATRPRAVSAAFTDGTWHLTLPGEITRAEVFVMHGPWSIHPLPSFPPSAVARQRARDFWLRQKMVPAGKIRVPDSTLQGILDANIRNLYQIRETVDGGVQFQPGPSVYRGLWVHDEVWHLSAAAFLGDFPGVRAGLASLLRFQQPNGQVKVMAPYPMNRETPLTVYMMHRYARMANDKKWLLDHWGAVERGMRWTEDLRASTLRDPSSPGYGLFPPAFSDGGLGGIEYEYGSVVWGLIGFQSAAAAAHWIGKDSLARHWTDEYRSLLASFRKAADRDRRRDAAGNIYLPMKVGDTSATTPPQQANFGILDAQGLGHLFDPRDEIVRGTMAMLDHELAEDLPLNAGWLKGGVWPFFGTLQGIAHVYQRNYDQAHRLLFSVANHASPLGTWFEEQFPAAAGKKVTGDGSNATASALFVKFIRRLIAIERGDTLELLAGIPPSWVRPGGKVALNDCPTLFGRITFELSFSGDGKRASLVLKYPRTYRKATALVDVTLLRAAGYRASNGGELPPSILAPFGTSYHLSFTRR